MWTNHTDSSTFRFQTLVKFWLSGSVTFIRPNPAFNKDKIQLRNWDKQEMTTVNVHHARNTRISSLTNPPPQQSFCPYPIQKCEYCCYSVTLTAQMCVRHPTAQSLCLASGVPLTCLWAGPEALICPPCLGYLSARAQVCSWPLPMLVYISLTYSS